MDDDEYRTCPYNNQHQILRFRLPSHILKCRKNYHGPPLEQCMYNATHLVPEGTMQEHLQTCTEHHQFNNTEYLRIVDGLRK